MRRKSKSIAALLRRDVVRADRLAPELDLALEQGARGVRRLLLGYEHLHAAVRKSLAHLRIGERVTQRRVEPLDDRRRRARWHEQHVPEIEIEFFVAEIGR